MRATGIARPRLSGQVASASAIWPAASFAVSLAGIQPRVLLLPRGYSTSSQSPLSAITPTTSPFTTKEWSFFDASGSAWKYDRGAVMALGSRPDYRRGREMSRA
jgi:hypothetical protein